MSPGGNGTGKWWWRTPICRQCCGSRNSRERGSTGRRSTLGGRLQCLIYKPTGREHFMPEMLDPEDVRPFDLTDELFASFPMESAVAGSDG